VVRILRRVVARERVGDEEAVGDPGDRLEAQVGAGGGQSRVEVPFVRRDQFRARLRDVETENALAAHAGNVIVALGGDVDRSLRPRDALRVGAAGPSWIMQRHAAGRVGRPDRPVPSEPEERRGRVSDGPEYARLVEVVAQVAAEVAGAVDVGNLVAAWPRLRVR